ncbi:hypothetical protein ACQKL5_07730 [Peribacillus sp. NPDC097675]|uniref:hypothetical protein n=1 Tax=Peribacillus sp. NPDC097675 TaxID=3390618 RepID=UPI003D05A841
MAANVELSTLTVELIVTTVELSICLVELGSSLKDMSFEDEPFCGIRPGISVQWQLFMTYTQ